MNVLIADDHELLRRGMRALLLEHFPDASVVEVANSRDAMAAVEGGDWDLALVDISMPGRDGLDLLLDLKRFDPRLPVLVVSAHLEEEFALRALKLGAAGYVSKQALSDELMGAVRKVLGGGRHVSAAVAERLARAASEGWTGAPHENLSQRELQVLRRIAGGATIKAIADELALSEKTIATYRRRLSGKLGLSTNVELARFALQHGLVE